MQTVDEGDRVEFECIVTGTWHFPSCIVTGTQHTERDAFVFVFSCRYIFLCVYVEMGAVTYAYGDVHIAIEICFTVC